MQDLTFGKFERMAVTVKERGGTVTVLCPGDYVTMPMLEWHAAFNLERTFSVNKVDLSIWDVPKLMHHTLQLHFDWFNKLDNLRWFQGTGFVGEELIGALALSSQVAFPGRGFKIEGTTKKKANHFEGVNAACQVVETGFQNEVQLIEERGVWLAYLSKSLELTEKLEKPYRIIFAGWSSDFRDSVGRWMKAVMYEPIENRQRKKKRRGTSD